jgi:hypothetical protein
MGPGRTGVKGVIRDRDEAAAINRSKRVKGIEELNKRMEKASLGGKTFLEEERERELQAGGGVEEEERWRRVLAAGSDVFGRRREGRFGHLREVGVEGFVAAVEREEKGVWVVVHLYELVRVWRSFFSLSHFICANGCWVLEKSLERCYALDDTLGRLARLHPQTKFLRSRASSLGFATIAATRSRRSLPGSYESDSDDDDDDDEPLSEGSNGVRTAVDTDMLPTLLVYRDGNLVHNWVRVDWEAGRAGVEELLTK